MNKEVVKKWVEELKKFSKEPSWKHLKFPLRMESPKGDLYSPEGILCNLHAITHNKDWYPKEASKKGRLRSYLLYEDSSLTAPDSVLQWVGLTAAEMSSIRILNETEVGFQKIIEQLESRLSE